MFLLYLYLHYCWYLWGNDDIPDTAQSVTHTHTSTHRKTHTHTDTQTRYLFANPFIGSGLANFTA